MHVLSDIALRVLVPLGRDFLSLAEQLGRWVDEVLGPIESYQLIGANGHRPGSLSEALASAGRLPAEHQAMISFLVPLPTGTDAWIRTRPTAGVWEIHIHRWVDGSKEPPAPPTWYPAALELARRFLRTGEVQRLELEANRGYATWLPSPPIARHLSAIVTTRAEVEAAYDDPDAFWQTWEGVEWFGEQALVYRAMGAVYHEQWLQRVVPRNLALTRIAKPKLTHYGIARVHPWERVFYEAPARRLQAGGYHPQKHIALFTCWLGPNEHLCAADIATAGGLLEKGVDADGRPIAEVHVQFGRHEMAVRERRPLLDRGVRVFYDDAVTGDTIELTE